MDISSLQSFLSSAKSTVARAVTDNLTNTHVILGNEAADLDSVISAIVFGYYTALSLSKEEKENTADYQHQSYVFPVVNCPRDDLSLRTEVVYFLRANGLKLDSLICRDEIDLAALHASTKLKLTLVDHNILSQADLFLQPSVVRVIDHHKREKALDRRDTIETVGSCCTLVAEMVLGLFDRDPIICNLLYGTILLDTVNLSAAAQRATGKDIKAVSELEECLTKSSGSRPVREDVYNPIVKARSDISQLTPEQLLRKDCKILKTPEISIAVPAVPLLSQKFLELRGAMDALRNCQRVNRCTAVVLMGFEVGDLTNIRRDLVVFSDGIHKAKQVCTPLENCENLHLQLIRHSTDSQCCYWLYDQMNIGLSRKFILPFLATHFGVKAQNQLDVDALAGVEILIPNGEMSPNKQNWVQGQVPSISYTSAQNLGIGDPISHGGSNQSSAYNSCPYTPLNSCAEPADGYPAEHYFLPSFNSREMIEKIESKRHKLRGYDKTEDQLNPGACSSYPFTPKNSYVDSNMDTFFDKQVPSSNPNTGSILHAIDSEVLLRKLMEKRRGDSNQSSNTSSKSQSLTKLNVTEEFLSSGDTPYQLSPGSHTPHQVQFNSRPSEIPDEK